MWTVVWILDLWGLTDPPVGDCWSRKQVGNIPSMNSVVLLSPSAGDFYLRTERCLRLGESSGVTYLHLENTFQGPVLPLHSLCS